MSYKLLIVFLLILSFQGCKEEPKVSNFQKLPSWYFKNSSDSTTIYGYGSSNTLKKAKSNAREDIAKSIKVKINSSLTMTSMSEKSSMLHKELFSQQTKHSISEYTDMILSDIKVDKYIQVNNIWYVRMSYINLPIVEQIKKTFDSKKLVKMKKHNPLVNCNFSKNLKVSFGYIPNYTIFFKDAIFFINIQNNNFILSNSDIKQFFFSKLNDNIKLYTKNKHLKEGDYFHFSITHTNDNYVSLIQIDELGKIIVHFDNLKAKQITYPNLELFEGLQSGITNNQNSAVEMYLAISCKEKNNFAIFEQVGLNFNEKQNATRFPNLYNLINSCEYSSLIIRTTK